MSSVLTEMQTKETVGRPNTAPAGFDPIADLPLGFLDFVLPLHRDLTSRQQMFIRKRAQVLTDSHQGKKPDYLPVSEARAEDWTIQVPDWCLDQRNQMTGPADDDELVVKMLNSGAPGVMLDLEDSMANCWTNLTRGISNILSALKGELAYYDAKRARTVGIAKNNTVVFTRPRGLHLSQAGILRDRLMSASLFDVAMVAYQTDRNDLQHPLSFYIPKSESAEEASWWRDLFQRIEALKGWPRGYVKCMALVESHPLAYQMEEFIYNLRDHLVGLNLGRWDYMASLAHFNLEDPAWVLPDRNTIPHDVPFFQRVRDLLANTCHKRGILAIGGMTALYPSRTDKELNQKALRVLAEDKRNEANCLMDGAWTGHPDQNEIAVQQFPHPNQLDSRKPDAPLQPNLRAVPKGVGNITLTGTRAAIRTVIRYRQGVLEGKGASLLDGYMEDLATDRIYRLMISQRIRHRDKRMVVDSEGKPVVHTPEFVSQLFDQELARILNELPGNSDESAAKKYREARHLSELMIHNGEFDPI
jgi:malate synthase